MISLRDVVTGFGNRDPLAEVWRRDLRGGGGGSAEITGTLPLRYIGNGKPLTDYLISGNKVQSGTPTPEAPVDVVGCGVRTGQLWEGEYKEDIAFVSGKYDVPSSYPRTIVYIPIIGGQTYTFSIKNLKSGTTLQSVFSVNEPAIGVSYTINGQTTFINHDTDTEFTRTAPNVANWLAVQIMDTDNLANDIMLNLGSTALPYEPYGYKLPLTINGTEYPIYLGQVETTRRIKKLVLDGTEEGWEKSILRAGCFALRDFGTRVTEKTMYCTHATYVSTASELTSNNTCYMGRDLNIWLDLFDAQTTIEQFKSYLAAQYAAGTPVTVWYVLAEPETGIVNEPLMKIGDYADTISFAQAGVTIPTVSGANVLDMTSTVKSSEVYIKGKGIKPTGYGQLVDNNSVRILDKNNVRILVHGQ